MSIPQSTTRLTFEQVGNSNHRCHFSQQETEEIVAMESADNGDNGILEKCLVWHIVIKMHCSACERCSNHVVCVTYLGPFSTNFASVKHQRVVSPFMTTVHHLLLAFFIKIRTFIMSCCSQMASTPAWSHHIELFRNVGEWKKHSMKVLRQRCHYVTMMQSFVFSNNAPWTYCNGFANLDISELVASN